MADDSLNPENVADFNLRVRNLARGQGGRGKWIRRAAAARVAGYTAQEFADGFPVITDNKAKSLWTEAAAAIRRAFPADPA